MANASKTRFRLDGCSFVIVTCVVTCLLLVVNVAIVTGLVGLAVSDSAQIWAERSKYIQAIRFIVPVLLLFAEWTIIEYALGWIFHKLRR